jgi:hypothetical protein
MSGTYLLLTPVSLSSQEEAYRHAMKAWGLSEATPVERIRFLLEESTETLLKLPPNAPITATIDKDLITSGGLFHEIEDPRCSQPVGKTWCRDILIGDAAADESAKLLGDCPFV